MVKTGLNPEYNYLKFNIFYYLNSKRFNNRAVLYAPFDFTVAVF